MNLRDVRAHGESAASLGGHDHVVRSDEPLQRSALDVQEALSLAPVEPLDVEQDPFDVPIGGWDGEALLRQVFCSSELSVVVPDELPSVGSFQKPGGLGGDEEEGT